MIKAVMGETIQISFLLHSSLPFPIITSTHPCSPSSPAEDQTHQLANVAVLTVENGAEDDGRMGRDQCCEDISNKRGLNQGTDLII